MHQVPSFKTLVKYPFQPLPFPGGDVYDRDIVLRGHRWNTRFALRESIFSLSRSSISSLFTSASVSECFGVFRHRVVCSEEDLLRAAGIVDGFADLPGKPPGILLGVCAACG